MAQSSWDEVIGGAIMLFLPLYLILQVLLSFAWTGRWRLAALVPLLGFVPALIVSLMGLAWGSNLWPILLILFAPLACTYFLTIGAVRAVVTRRRPA